MTNPYQRLLPLLLWSCAELWGESVPSSLIPARTFYASFDRALDADAARGDGKLYNAADYKNQKSAAPGAGTVDAGLEPGSGVKGSGALRFRSKNTKALFFRGAEHLKLEGGAISFWLRLDPQTDLSPGFCDPIQLTGDAYNDSAIWVDFTKDDVPRHFRLGVFGSLKAWNPSDIPPDKNPAFLQRLIVVERPPFSRQAWTHIAATWRDLGTPKGTARLFVNGQPAGQRDAIAEAFVWDPERLAIRLGVNYTGLMDEVAAFDRPLSETEVRSLYSAGSRP